MKAPLRKVILARYIQVLEAVGFVLIGLLIAAMIVSAVFRIEDGVKFRLDSVDPQADPVVLPSRSWVRRIHVRQGQKIEAGAVCAEIVADPAAVAVVEAADALQRVEHAAGAKGTSPLSADLFARTSEMSRTLRDAAEQFEPVPVRAPVGGIVREAPNRPWDTLEGKVLEGNLMAVDNYGVLRLQLPLAGENAPRVRINLLAEEDVKDWNQLTRLLCGDGPAPSKAIGRTRQMLDGRLEDIRPGRVPLKRDQPEVVGALNEILERGDLYGADAWPADLPHEALALIDKGPAQLSRDERIRLNRMLLEIALGDAVARSEDESQPVKATFFVPPPPGTPGTDGRPAPYPMQGQIAAEPRDDSVVAEFYDPPAELAKALRARAGNDELEPVYAVGSVVVGRVTLFRFLFR